MLGMEQDKMRKEEHYRRLSVPTLGVYMLYQLKEILQIYFLQLCVSL